jgi:hypothetical protein
VPWGVPHVAVPRSSRDDSSSVNSPIRVDYKKIKEMEYFVLSRRVPRTPMDSVGFRDIHKLDGRLNEMVSS